MTTIHIYTGNITYTYPTMRRDIVMMTGDISVLFTKFLLANINDSFLGFRGQETLQYHDFILNSSNINISIKCISDEYKDEVLKFPYSKFSCSDPVHIGQIFLTHEFTAFLWGVTYYLVVVYENIQQQIDSTDTWNGRLTENATLKVTRTVFSCSLTLKNKSIMWPLSLPSPAVYLSDEEKHLVGVVNKIFLDAISYFLFHEYAHVVQGHAKFFEKTRYNVIHPISKVTKKDLEREADNFAHEQLIKFDDNDEYKHHTAIGLVIACIASLFGLSCPMDIKQSSHPDVDVRLFTIVNRFGELPTSKDFYIKHLACIGLEHFCQKWNICNFSERKFNNVDDLLNAYSVKLDNFKNFGFN